jgi:hypothetical protein
VRINGGVVFFSLSSCPRGEMISVNGASGRVDHVNVAFGSSPRKEPEFQRSTIVLALNIELTRYQGLRRSVRSR